MKDHLLIKSTNNLLDNYISKPSHALLLAGAKGMGKQSVSDRLASTILNVPLQNLSLHPYICRIHSIDSKAIGIDQIRELDHFLSLKVPNSDSINRIVQIEDGDLLTIEAQNALLKILEEPPAGTIIIITASHPQALLPTIRSRSQTIQITKPSYDDLLNFFTTKGYDKKEVETAIKMSGGLPGLMSAILNNEEHPLKKATDTARNILSKSHYQRLIMADELAKDKQLAIDTLYILKQMAHLSLLSSSDSSKWHKILKASYQADKSLSTNGQPKLTLDRLMLSL